MPINRDFVGTCHSMSYKSRPSYNPNHVEKTFYCWEFALEAKGHAMACPYVCSTNGVYTTKNPAIAGFFVFIQSYSFDG